MTRYLVHRDGQLVGAVQVSEVVAEVLRREGYRLLPA